MISKLLLFTWIMTTLVFAQTKTIPSIVSIEWLKAHNNDKDLVILDLRTSDEYEINHIKNAVSMPGLKNLFDENFFMPKLGILKELFSNAGIDSTKKVVAYDNGDFIWAARLYWILETLGHNEVGILKIGYGDTITNNLEISDEPYIPSRKEFVPQIDNSKIETKLSTLLSLNKKTIIDGRKQSHYLGKESIAKRYGHIPTAKNYACTQNYQVNENGNEMKDLTKLKEVYKDIPKNKEIILYCDGGADAALNYIVLQELGYKASVYDGSWAEWGNDNAVPIVNPSKDYN